MFNTVKEALVKEGDYIIFFVSPNDLKPLTVCADQIIQHKLGKFRHSDIVGLTFGSKVRSVDGQKYVTILRPTPELWTRSLPHRTQILYLPDISFILRKLNIKPGSVVIESGTGSGSFSHSIARTIFPDGHLYTYEFHRERVQLAEKEFAEHGLGSIVTIEHKDVITHGFGKENEADAVFLDLPATWDAVRWAKIAIKKSGQARICCFSPCIEQVLKNFESLKNHGFVDIQMFETLTRDYVVRELDCSGIVSGHVAKKRAHEDSSSIYKIVRPNLEAKGHTSYLTFARLPFDTSQ